MDGKCHSRDQGGVRIRPIRGRRPVGQPEPVNADRAAPRNQPERLAHSESSPARGRAGANTSGRDRGHPIGKAKDWPVSRRAAACRGTTKPRLALRATPRQGSHSRRGRRTARTVRQPGVPEALPRSIAPEFAVQKRSCHPTGYGTSATKFDGIDGNLRQSLIQEKRDSGAKETIDQPGAPAKGRSACRWRSGLVSKKLAALTPSCRGCDPGRPRSDKSTPPGNAETDENTQR